MKRERLWCNKGLPINLTSDLKCGWDCCICGLQCDGCRWLDILNEWGFKKLFPKEAWSSFCSLYRMNANSYDAYHQCPNRVRVLPLLCAAWILIIYLQSLLAVGMLHSWHLWGSSSSRVLSKKQSAHRDFASHTSRRWSFLPIYQVHSVLVLFLASS